jgi:hypothetical protein
MEELRAEQSPERTTIPIEEIIPGIGEADADMFQRLASFEGLAIDDGVLARAMDMAFHEPYHTAAMIRDPGLIPSSEGPLFTPAIGLAYEAQRSGVAYRITDNPRVTWKLPLSQQAIAVVKRDVEFSQRRDLYQQTLYEPWFRSMQSRLIVCVARVSAGKEMERVRPTRSMQEWLNLRRLSDPEDI